MAHDEINHPSHYTQGKYECIDVLEDLAKQGMDFRLLWVIKYLWRTNLKDDPLTNLKKARWFLDRKIRELESLDQEAEKTIGESISQDLRFSGLPSLDVPDAGKWVIIHDGHHMSFRDGGLTTPLEAIVVDPGFIGFGFYVEGKGRYFSTNVTWSYA